METINYNQMSTTLKDIVKEAENIQKSMRSLFRKIQTVNETEIGIALGLPRNENDFMKTINDLAGKSTSLGGLDKYFYGNGPQVGQVYTNKISIGRLGEGYKYALVDIIGNEQYVLCIEGYSMVDNNTIVRVNGFEEFKKMFSYTGTTTKSRSFFMLDFALNGIVEDSATALDIEGVKFHNADYPTTNVKCMGYEVTYSEIYGHRFKAYFNGEMKENLNALRISLSRFDEHYLGYKKVNDDMFKFERSLSKGVSRKLFEVPSNQRFLTILECKNVETPEFVMG